MLWSGRGPKGYAMGSACSEGGILGPWKQNKRLAFQEDGGHGMVFKTFEGKLLMTVHQPNQTPNERPKFFPAKISDGEILLEKGRGSASGAKAPAKKSEPKKEAVKAASPVEKKKSNDSVRFTQDMPYWLL